MRAWLPPRRSGGESPACGNGRASPSRSSPSWPAPRSGRCAAGEQDICEPLAGEVLKLSLALGVPTDELLGVTTGTPSEPPAGESPPAKRGPSAGGKKKP